MRTTKLQSVCEWAGVAPSPPGPMSKIGIALGSIGKLPIHGLRRPLEGDTNGWYIWCGEYSDADDFFSPLHAEHVSEHLPSVVEYLDLPSGYRFLIDGADYEDVWFDASLLSER